MAPQFLFPHCSKGRKERHKCGGGRGQVLRTLRVGCCDLGIRTLDSEGYGVGACTAHIARGLLRGKGGRLCSNKGEPRPNVSTNSPSAESCWKDFFFTEEEERRAFSYVLKNATSNPRIIVVTRFRWS